MVTTFSTQNLYEPASPYIDIIQPKLYMWPSRTLYFGPLEYVGSHAYGSVILHVGLYGPFFIRIEKGAWQACSCAIIPPGIKHELRVDYGVLGKLFVEAGSLDYQYFCKAFTFRSGLLFFQNKKVVDLLKEIYEQNLDIDAANTKIDQLLHYQENKNFKIDHRVDRTIELMQLDVSKNLTEEFLANEVGLSVSRFRHLFHETMGISYRHYRVWRRLLFAAKSLYEKDNLTTAALNSGFSDLSHFSNHYKKTFGVKPSFVFRDLNEFHTDT